MRPASLTLLLLALAGGAVGWVTWRDATEESRAWEALLALDGIEIPPLTHREIRELYDRFDRFAVGREDVGGPRFAPWRVLRVDRDTTAERVVLLRLSRGHGVPGRDYLRAAVLDANRRRLSTSEFGSPWRAAIGDVRPRDSRAQLGLHFEDQLGGGTGVMYYAVVEDRFELLRLENDDGSLRRNDCGYPNHRTDPAPLIRPPDAWDLRLSSPSPFTVLSALTYLGGRHFTPSEPPEPRVAAQSAEEIRSVAAARSHPGVRARVADLRKSPDPWIREAAEAVPLDGSR